MRKKGEDDEEGRNVKIGRGIMKRKGEDNEEEYQDRNRNDEEEGRG